MPTVTADGAALRYATSGDTDRPTVAFLADVGFGPWSWGWQAPALSGPYRTVVPATRGTNGSEAEGPYSVDRLAADLDAVLADVGARRAHLVGAGLGGAVALRYAREYGRARSLTLFGTAATGDRVDRDALEACWPSDPTRLRASLSLSFSERFLADSGFVDDVAAWRREEDAVGDALEGHREALRSFDAGPLYDITLPALVCHGLEDPVVPIAASEALADGLPRGRFEAVEGRRCCYVEHAPAVTDAMQAFLERVEAGDAN